MTIYNNISCMKHIALVSSVRCGAKNIFGLLDGWGPRGRHRTSLVILIAVLPAISSVPVVAVENENTIEEIVITIGKRVENLQDAAGSVQAFNADVIENAGISNISDLMSMAPNVVVEGTNSNSGSGITIRGISVGFSSQSPVARHVNGLFKFDPQSYDGQFYDLESIEVAQGPAGTVYGRNATGGAMNISWKKPHEEQEILGDVTVGNYDLRESRMVVNLPFFGEGDERLMGRFVLQSKQQDGYIDNGLTGDGGDAYAADDLEGRISLRSVFSENGEAIVRARWFKQQTPPNSGVPIYLETDTFSDLSSLGIPAGQFFDALNGLTVYKSVLAGALGMTIPQVEGLLTAPREFMGLGLDPELLVPVLPVSGTNMNSRAHLLGDPSLEDFSLDGELNWTFQDVGIFGDIDMSLLGGYERIDQLQVNNSDSIELTLADNVQDLDIDLSTAELRFSSLDGDNLEWIMGMFVFERRSDIMSASYTPFGVFAEIDDVTQLGYAPFVNLIYHFTEAFEVSSGLRWNVDEYDIDRTQLPSLTNPAGGRLQVDDTHEEWTGELAMKYFLSDDHMAYLKFSRGYKSGFLDIDDTNDPVNGVSRIEPELLYAAETGVKTSWLDNRLQVNLATFYYDYKELQVSQFDGFRINTVNAAEATVWGIETNVVFKPTAAWQINASLGYLDASFDEFTTLDPFDQVVKDLKGNKLEEAPEWQASFYSLYEFDLGDFGSLSTVAEVSWSDSYYRRPFNLDLIDKVDASTRTDLRIIWRDADEHWDAQLFIENLENKKVISTNVVLGGGELEGVVPGYGVLPPRMFGLRVGYRL